VQTFLYLKSHSVLVSSQFAKIWRLARVEAVAVLAIRTRSVEVDDDVVVEVDDVVPLEAGDGDCAVTVSALCMVAFIITVELWCAVQ
jgi:hypothetical protein